MVVRTTEQHNLRVLMEVLQNEAETERPGAEAVLRQLAETLFILLLRAWMEQQVPVPGLFHVLAEPRLRASLEAMICHPETFWTLDELAYLCHMSRATFARLFTKAAGMPPAELFTQVRMQTAAQLLGQQGATSARVGAAVGCQSEAAFSQLFPSLRHGASRIQAPTRTLIYSVDRRSPSKDAFHRRHRRRRDRGTDCYPSAAVRLGDTVRRCIRAHANHSEAGGVACQSPRSQGASRAI